MITLLVIMLGCRRMVVRGMSPMVVVVVVMVRQQAVTQRKNVGQPEQRDDEETDWHLTVKVGSFGV